MPSEYCVKSKTGCVHSTYDIHSKAIKVEAEKNGQGMRPSLAMDHAVRAAYLVGDGVRKLVTLVNSGTQALFFTACFLHLYFFISLSLFLYLYSLSVFLYLYFFNPKYQLDDCKATCTSLHRTAFKLWICNVL